MKNNILTTLKNNEAKLQSAMVGIYVAVMAALPALADNSDEIINGITTGTGKVWDILVAVVAPIAAVALAVCAVKMIWGNQKAAEDAKSMVIRIIIAIAIVMLAPSLISAVQGWFKKATWF